jgi:hypothetical protein
MTFGQVSIYQFLNPLKMDEKLFCLDRLRRRQEIRFWIRKPDMSFGEARLFLELTKKHFARLIKNGIVPYHKPVRKARYFNKTELNNWLVNICFNPESEPERKTAEHFIKRGRVRL